MVIWFPLLIFIYSCLIRVPCLIVEVDRIRYCIKVAFSFCYSWKTDPKYKYWNRYRVERSIQRDTYLSEVSRPPVDNVEQMIFLANGQQDFYGIGNGQEHSITGSPKGWKKNWEEQTKTKRFNLSNTSFPAQLVNQNYAPSNSTALFLAFNHQFNYLRSTRTKRKMENAYYDWLKSSFNPKKIQLIFLAGFSRGACLAVRLAKKFNAEFPGIRLVVNSYDGVCNAFQKELKTRRRSHIDNPLRAGHNYYAWITNLKKVFKNRTTGLLYVSLFVGGGNPIPYVDATVRAFTYKWAFVRALDNCWIRQEWFIWGHKRMGTIQIEQNGLKDYLLGVNKVFNGEKCNKHCPLPLGHFDGRACLVGTPPNGTTAFVIRTDPFNQVFAHTYIDKNYHCNFDTTDNGKYCIKATVPSGVQPFVNVKYNKWYYVDF